MTIRKIGSFIVSSAVLVNSLFFDGSAFAMSMSESKESISSLHLSQADIPDAIDYESALEKGHISRNTSEEKNLNSIVFENEDGSNSLYLFSYPVKYIDDNGDVRDKSLEIVSADETGAFVTKSSDITTLFNSKLSDGVNMSFYDNELSFYPLFLSDSDSYAELSSDNKTVSYDINDSISLDYSLTYQGVKENIVINEYNGKDTFAFDLITNGLHLAYNETGAISICDDKEISTGNISDIIIYDSDNNISYGKISYDTVSENEEYVLNIQVDSSFLEDANTVYPIYIDPTIDVDYTHCGPFGLDGEAGIVHSTIYSDDTYSHNSTIVTGKFNSKIARSLMRFPGLVDYGGTGFLSMDSSLITSAKVYLKDVGYQSDINAIDVYCHKYNKNWSNSSALSWNTYANDYETTYLSYNNICHSNGVQQNPIHTYAFDITTLARQWADDPYGQCWKNGIMFKANSVVESGNTLYASFGYYNSVYYAPYLTIDYETPYNYEYAKDADITYTYHSTPMQLQAGETYIFETEKSSSYNDCDTELFLFKADMSADSSDTWYNDDISSSSPVNRYSRITAQIQTSGKYILMAKVYSNASFTGSLQTGYCKISSVDPITNIKTTIKDNAKLGGYILAIPSDKSYINTLYNSFTANQNPSNLDTILYVLSGTGTTSKKVIGYNDDYSNSVSPGDHDWGRGSRVEQNYYTTHPSSILVSTYSESSTGTSEIYALCEGKYPSSSYFYNYKADDAIISAPYTYAYNCIAYSGGISSYWINPTFTRYGSSSRLTPWYSSNTETAYDCFYGNNPPRYNGATTYSLTNSADDAVINVYKNGTSWTHASVRIPGNDQMHGYAWESKCGASYRAFHERQSLNNTDDINAYGVPVRYYSISGIFTSNSSELEDAITFEESVERGLTTFLSIEPTEKEVLFLKNVLNKIENEKIDKFDQLYISWIDAVNKKDELHMENDSYYFTLLDEYKTLSSYINDNPELYYLIIRNYLEGETDIYNETLFSNTLVNKNDFTTQLADSIRINNNEVSIASLKEDKYIAPTIETNMKSFAVSLLNEEACYYLGAEKILD